MCIVFLSVCLHNLVTRHIVFGMEMFLEMFMEIKIIHSSVSCVSGWFEPPSGLTRLAIRPRKSVLGSSSSSFRLVSRFLKCCVLFDSVSQSRGTIKDKAGFNPGEDASALRKAIEGIGERNASENILYHYVCSHSLSKFVLLRCGGEEHPHCLKCMCVCLCVKAPLRRLWSTFWLREAALSASRSVKRTRTQPER